MLVARGRTACVLVLLAVCTEGFQLVPLHCSREVPTLRRTQQGRVGWNVAPRPLHSVFRMAADSAVTKADEATKGGENVVLWAEGLTKTYDGLKIQFQDISLVLSRGERAGLIGANGCGKSTLMKVLAGKEPSDGGDVRLRKGVVTVYVEQDPEFEPGSSIAQVLYAGPTPVMAALREYEAAAAAMSAGGEVGRFERAAERMEAAGAWGAQGQAQRMLDTLLPKYAAAHNTKVDVLSGGERKRLALAAGLLQAPDLLLLDEPTNHLDLPAIDWLETTLALPNTAVVLVTHDRYLLERTCSYILELSDSALFRHAGSYSAFLEARAAREAAGAAGAELARKQAKRELEWVRRMPKARETKSKARVARYHDLVAKANAGPAGKTQLTLNQGASARLGGVVVEMEGACVELDVGTGEPKTVLRDFTYTFNKGERIGIVGGNGVGKTTFLRALAGEVSLAAGEMRVGETVKVGYYQQQGLDMPPDLTVLEFVVQSGALASSLSQRDVDAWELTGQARASGGGGGDEGKADAFALLERFQFPRARAYERVGALSGGERRRLQLLGVLAQRPNVLLLDEPSNDLDLGTLHALETFLHDDFQGVVLTVSHDRAFMDAVARQLFVFEGDGVVRSYQGAFSDFLLWQKQRAHHHAPAPAPPAPPSAPRPKSGASGGAVKKKMSYKEKREWEALPGALSALETERGELDKKLAAAAAAYTDLALWTERLAEVNAEIDERETRWLELMEEYPDLA